ncbi:hypothetical protein [Arthrobacter sp. NPDC056493]|uniref:hypothetical protein n=1 Tax=Arthrobacter sp. NPDC056493 TaxID=3345839 RepID=UPI00366F1E0D
MTQHTSHRIRYPHHWPLQVPRLAATRPQEPQAATQAFVAEAQFAGAQFAGAQSAEAQSAKPQHDGELVTAPWMGLHYLTEGP